MQARRKADPRKVGVEVAQRVAPATIKKKQKVVLGAVMMMMKKKSQNLEVDLVLVQRKAAARHQPQRKAHQACQ